MTQPAGTRVYRGRRVSLPGSEITVSKDEKVQAEFNDSLKKSGDFHSKGKTAEKEAREKAKLKAGKKPEVKADNKKTESQQPQGDKK